MAGTAITRRFTITGEVQGVGFRWSAQGEAERLGLVGRVRNRTDGAVEIVAQGERASMDSFAQWLEQGPRWAKVADVDAEPVDEIDADTFEITR